MKTMTCKQLGGACDLAFEAETFEEMVKQSKNHGNEMLNSGDEEHRKAMQEMQELMQHPNAMMKWFGEKRMEFESLPENG